MVSRNVSSNTVFSILDYVAEGYHKSFEIVDFLGAKTPGERSNIFNELKRLYEGEILVRRGKPRNYEYKINSDNPYAMAISGKRFHDIKP